MDEFVNWLQPGRATKPVHHLTGNTSQIKIQIYFLDVFKWYHQQLLRHLLA